MTWLKADATSGRAFVAMTNPELTVHKLSIPHNAYVFVGDGRKALFLRNEGDEKFPNLKTERVFVDDNPPTHEQGSDRPGRDFGRMGTNRRSGLTATDWHELEERRFTQEVAAALEQLVRANGVTALAIVAPPRALADLRHAIHKDVKGLIFAEIDRDLTKHPIADIERHLVG
jgi:protein required for attachment to host cells